MVVTNKTIKRNWLLLILTVLLGFFIVTVFIIVTDINDTTVSGNRFNSYIRNTMKDIVKNEVESRIDEIEFDISIISEKEKNVIKNKIDFVERILKDSEMMDIEDEDLRRAAGINFFENALSENNGYFNFVLSPDGILISTETNKSINNLDVLNYVDDEGYYFARDILKVVDLPEGKYFSHYWPKEKGGKSLKKTSYCKYISELDVIIGISYYEEDIQSEFKRQIFSRLQNYYEGKENYIFIISYEGISYVSGDREQIGHDVSNILDSKGLPLHGQFLDLLSKNNEGFINYYYTKKNSDILSEKISFIKALDGWDAYIGMGFHNDDLNDEINKYSAEFNKMHLRDMIIILIMLLIISIIVFILIIRGHRLHVKLMQREEIIFEQLFQLSSEGILIVSKKGEVLHQNVILNKIFGDDIKMYISSDGNLKLKNIKNNIFSVSTYLERVYFLKYKKEAIVYNNEDSLIYFISDVTEEYIKSNELEQLALYDVLTKLPNRRKLMNDYEDLLSEPCVDDVIIAIIDLDKFKNINDTYGHDIGDEVLKYLAETFTKRLRDTDAIYRFGGEEFVVLIKKIDLNSAKKVLMDTNRLFSKLIEEKLGFKMTFSGGAVKVNTDGHQVLEFEEAIKKSDVLLYQAKSNGRNKIATHKKS